MNTRVYSSKPHIQSDLTSNKVDNLNFENMRFIEARNELQSETLYMTSTKLRESVRGLQDWKIC